MRQTRGSRLGANRKSGLAVAIATLLTVLVSNGCDSAATLPSFAFAPTPFTTPQQAPFRSERPVSLIATSPLLQATLISGAGLPLVAISYPEPMPRGEDADGRLQVLVAWPGAGGPPGDPTVVTALLRADALLAGSSLQSARVRTDPAGAVEVDALVVCGVLGSGLDSLARLVRDPRLRIRQLLHIGVAPRMAEGRVVLDETAVVDLGEGRTLHTLAGESLLASGRYAAERYTQEIDAEPRLAGLLAAALQSGEDVRIDRVFAGKPNLDWSLPRLGPGRPRLEVIKPGRDLVARGDAVTTELSGRAVLDLSYDRFRLLLLGDLGRPGQDELFALGTASDSWDSTCLLAPSLAGLEVSRRLVEQLDFQVGLGFGGDGGDRYAPAPLVRRARPESLHLTEALGRPHHLRVTTDGVVFQVVALPVTGGDATELTPWLRCLEPRELDGLCDRSASGKATR